MPSGVDAAMASTCTDAGPTTPSMLLPAEGVYLAVCSAQLFVTPGRYKVATLLRRGYQYPRQFLSTPTCAGRDIHTM